MLAIIIPYYKLTFFNETLKSIANQTDNRFKVYIGNDNSPEDPIELIDLYKAKIDLKYYKFKENLGGVSLSKQWDRCIALASDEEWLMILGDDDYLGTNVVEEFYNNLNEIEGCSINVVRFASCIVKEKGVQSKIYTHPKIESSPDFFYNKFFNGSRGSLTEQVFRKDAYTKFGFREFPLAWGADNFAWLDFSEFGDMYTINKAIAYIRVSSENISRGGYGEDQKRLARYMYFSLIIENYLEKFKSEQHIHLLKHYEKLVYRSKRISFSFYTSFCSQLLMKKEYVEFLKFQRRILLQYLK